MMMNNPQDILNPSKTTTISLEYPHAPKLKHKRMRLSIIDRFIKANKPSQNNSKIYNPDKLANKPPYTPRFKPPSLGSNSLSNPLFLSIKPRSVTP